MNHFSSGKSTPPSNMKQMAIKAYHFTSDTISDGSPIPKRGVWLKHTGEVIPCQSGLHASIHPFDALQYAPGKYLHLVEVGGKIQHHSNDKIVGSKRRILKTIDAEKLMRDFARWNAMQVIHLWKDVPKVVLDFLKTGDESLMDAAWSAAWSATRTTAWDAARSAAADAAWSASTRSASTRSAAWDKYIQKTRRKFKQMVDEAFKSA